MKFATWSIENTEQAGIISADMKSVLSFADAGLSYKSVLDFIIRRTEDDMNVLRERAKENGIPIDKVTLLAPIPRPHHDVVCIGLNYREHLEESVNFLNADQKRDASIYFSKRVVKAVGPGGNIKSYEEIESRLDYEAELGVILGKDAFRVPTEKAMDYVFGICCFNDISARDLQHGHKQWYFGKSMDTFTVFGPYIVTLDEFTLPLNLDIMCRVNGEERQNSNTSKMIYSVEEIISELSTGITLDAGTIIATGTPVGVGAGSNPPRCMKPGDVVEVEIEGCGILKNQIV